MVKRREVLGIEKRKMSVNEIEEKILEFGSDHLPTFGGSFEGGIHLQQSPDELANFICFLLNEGKEIKNYLEIGVASGGTTYVVNYFFRPENIVLIDNNIHPKTSLRQEILENVDRKELIGDSKDEEIVKNAAGEYDLIVIDGDHSYEGVSIDFNNYSKYLSEGGFVMFHDSFLDFWGVKRLVAELKQNEDFKFVNEWLSSKYPICGIALFEKIK